MPTVSSEWMMSIHVHVSTTKVVVRYNPPHPTLLSPPLPSPPLLVATGEGPLYGVLRLLVLGQTPDMLPTTKVEAKEQGGSGLTSAVKLLVCIVGLQVSYLTWGVLQVQEHTHACAHTDIQTH